MAAASALPMDDVWLPLTRADRPLTVDVPADDLTTSLAGRFDYTTNGHEEFVPFEVPDLPERFGIGAIVGKSGSGKSTLLREFGDPTLPQWGPGSIASHFTDPDDAADKFYAAGLSSVPTWCRPYHVLSNGERFRADLARSLASGAAIDEFTSVVDRNVAAGASRSLRGYVNAGKAERIVVATVHRDVLPWLEPDWIIDTDSATYCVRPRECLLRPTVVVDVRQVERTLWNVFAPHHYLTSDLHPFARCYVATVSDDLCAFAAAIPFPHATIRNGWRETRLVTLPDFQGLGIGPRLSDWVAEAHVRAGYTYYGKTTHPRLGEYRDRHPRWTATSHSRRKTNRPRQAPTSFGDRETKPWIGSTRVSYSHRYTLATEGTN